jgi:hypothetical protein
MTTPAPSPKPGSATPEKAIEELGGEPLYGSGFEGETPEADFSEDPAPADAPAGLPPTAAQKKVSPPG